MLGLDTGSRRRVWLKRAIWLGILTAVIAAGLWWYFQIGGSAATITYQTTPAARTDLIIEVQATGTIQPTTQVDVSSEMSGVIRTVSVDNN
ncbi:MAG: efflux RND transporter periplasmic adaptor subunit, partial [Aestuariivirga sp.]